MPYLFAHFREKLTPDGEQIYLAVSKNGYDFTAVNGSKPVITCDKGEMGCRDIDVIRLKDNSFGFYRNRPLHSKSNGRKSQRKLG